MVKEKIYQNGLRIIINENHNSQIVTFNLLVNVGSEHEENKFYGVAHFLEHMAFKSTKYHTTQEIATMLDGFGADSNAWTSKTDTTYYFSSITKYYKECLKIYSEMIFDALILKEDVDVERGAILEELSMCKDNADRILYEAKNNLIYPNTNIAHRILGEKEDIESITSEKLKEFKAKYYKAENMVISISGDVKFDEVESLIEEYFVSKFPYTANFNDIIRTPYEVNNDVKYQAIQKEDTQIKVQIVFPAPIDNGDYSKKYTYKILSALLGDGSSSYLYSIIREKFGYVYYISSYSYSTQTIGEFSINFASSLSNVEKCLKEIKNILRNIAKNGIDEFLLNKVLNIVESSLIFSLETNYNISATNLYHINNKHRYIPIDETLQKYRKVTIDDINLAAKEIFNCKNFHILAIGNGITADHLKVFED